MIWRYQHFEILRREDGSPWELGRGAMGTTYRARDTNLQADVALKVVHASALGNAGTREQLFNEARAIASLRHRNVAAIYHLGEQGGECFFAMELVEGCPLDARLRETGKLPARQALEIAIQVVQALAAAEKQGLVHGDIKPANLMLARDDDGRTVVKVIDFGLAKQKGRADRAAGFQGTPQYASPEQIQDGSLDGRSDMYSLGVTLYQMLAGAPPFSGTPAEVLDAHLHAPPPAGLLSGVPESVQAVVLRLLEKNPADRPPTAAALRTLLTGCGELPPAPAPQPAPDHPPVAPSGRSLPAGVIVGMAAAVFVIVALAAAFFVLPAVLAKPPAEIKPMVAAAQQPARPPVQPTPKPERSAAPAPDSLESLMAEAVALHLAGRYSDALLASARIADRFREASVPRERMEMIAAFLRSNAYPMTSSKFASLRPALEAAAARNVVSAQMILGERLRNLAPSESLKWFKAAAENGQTEAMTQAGLMMANGRGTSGPDMRLALSWFQRAADHGDTDAMAALAECLIFGKGTAKDPRRAAALLTAAAAFNHPGALNLLGDLYVKGSGVPQDYAEAFRLFSRAAALGSGEGVANLGVLHMGGKGVAANPAKAVSIWRTGAEKGYPACMLNYAKALESGSGTTENAREARRWYAAAAKAGNPLAVEWCRKNGLTP